jgi:L-threonylcarbamoyladenylate synthase
VSSANRSGLPAATTADEAQEQLGEAVSVYLDGGPCTDSIPSTILDLTGTVPRLLRAGAISVDRLRRWPDHRRQRAAARGRPPTTSRPRRIR